jgi:MscS family membrane protein
VSKSLSWLSHNTNIVIDDLIIQRIDTPIAMGIVLIGIRFALKYLEFPEIIEMYVHRGFVMMSALTVTWLVTRIVRAIIENQYKKYAEEENVKVDEQMLLFIKRVSLILLWSMGAVVGLNNAGVDVSALIAGLGIGGLAFALAAQDTVKNLIGGLIIFFDKPFHMGDVIQVKEFQGTVVYIGMRSTRIRNAAGRIITIPNAQFSDSGIENITVEPTRRMVSTIPLLPETSAVKVKEAIALINDAIKKTADVLHDDTDTFVEKISGTSIDITLIYFVEKGNNVHQKQNEVNLAILQRLQQAGIPFSNPISSSK